MSVHQIQSGGICYLVIQAGKSDSIYNSTMEISVLQVTPQRRNLSGYMYHHNT